MINPESMQVENLLARPVKHRQWERDYRTPDNEGFYERAFTRILSVLKPPSGARFLDVGCGSCAHSVRLARRGFNVHAVDFSESALGMARANIKFRGLEERITVARENLLALSLPDASFDYVLCWGVLMHIPEVGRAVSELARIVRPGGTIIISEGNQSSLEAAAARNLKRLLGKEKANKRETPAGVEYWMESGGGALVTREANISWLIARFEEHGLRLRKRVAGQFSESYTRLSAKPLKTLVHGFNRFWFSQVKWPSPAFGNIILMRKPL